MSGLSAIADVATSEAIMVVLVALIVWLAAPFS